MIQNALRRGLVPHGCRVLGAVGSAWVACEHPTMLLVGPVDDRGPFGGSRTDPVVRIPARHNT
jgi:hypothetical protein